MNKTKVNPIEELRKLEVPVSDQEWESIIHDRRYTQKFGRKPGLSPKGRAALIIGAAVVLITVPILVKTLSQKGSETEIPVPTVTESSVEQPDVPVSTTVQTTTSTVQETEVSEPRHTPSQTVTSAQAANHENATMNSVIAARAHSTNDQEITDRPTTNPSTSTTPQKPAQIVTQDPPKQVVALQPSQNISRQTVDEPLSVTEESVPKSEPEEISPESDQFFIPSAFTPNGDGLNDLFYVQSNFSPRNFDISILSRNGDLLFHSRDISIGWDGKLHGNTLPQGMYVYIIKYKDSQGNDQVKQGQILLIP